MILTANVLCSCVMLCVAAVAFINLKRKGKATLSVTLRASPGLELSGRPQFKSLASSALDIATTLPPSQRPLLEGVTGTLSALQSLRTSSHNTSNVITNLLSYEEDYQKAPGFKYCFSGFSVDEIRALGDFTDYATLSEVPLPQPYRDFNIEHAEARPYRPFRWAYHQTMSLTKLEPNWWIELESTYRTRIAERQLLYKKHGDGVLSYLPGSELACKELMEMVLQFLCARYPHYFILDHSAAQSVLHNKILGITTDLRSTHPLLVLLDHVPEDFAVMLRHPETGYYHFRAGVICSALGWNVASKIGKQLHEIHEPIPDYREKMMFSMDRFFTKLPTGKPIQRGSWGLEVDQPLYMPPGDPHEIYRDSQTPELTLERCHLRVDWQTLRRLPLSGAVIFNFKGLFTPVSEFKDEPYIPALLLKILNEGKENLMKYKNTWHVEHVVKPALERWKHEQEISGLTEKHWEEKTLDETPFFPGWKDKWKQRQGF